MRGTVKVCTTCRTEISFTDQKEIETQANIQHRNRKKADIMLLQVLQERSKNEVSSHERTCNLGRPPKKRKM